MTTITGGCYCGNIRVELELSREPSTYTPRACDCDFCRQHGMSYVSDPQGSLRIRILDERQTAHFRQGSRSAEFLFCATCAVVVGATYRGSDGRVFAAVNARVIGGPTSFGAEQPVSPRTLSPGEKQKRWQDIWFSNVTWS